MTLQAIVDRKTLTREHASQRGRHFTWWVSTTHVVTLACGHVKEYHGDYAPKKQAKCEECK